MINKIHILGASGSGTTTLAKAFAKRNHYKHFDTDNYYWHNTDNSFTKVRNVDERIAILGEDLEKNDKWILSGSLCGWGDVFIPKFDLVVFIYTPKDIRINRLIQREKERYGIKVEPGGERYESFLEFIDWASKYDEGDMEIRSKLLHDNWLENLNCPVLRVEGDLTVEERVNVILDFIENKK